MPSRYNSRARTLGTCGAAIEGFGSFDSCVRHHAPTIASPAAASVHPVFAIGGVVLILLWPLRHAVAHSEMWQPIGEWIAELGR